MSELREVAMAQLRKLKPDSDIIETLKTLKTPAPAPSASQIEDVHCSRGTVVGRLTFSKDGHTINCRIMGPIGQFIPGCIGRVTDMKSDALFVLLVTNESAFRNLSQAAFYDRFPCIIVRAMLHPNGQLDVGTQLFFNKLKSELNIPVFALGGCDPNEFTVMLAYGADFWLGIRPSDLDKYELPKSSKIRLCMKKNHIKIVTDLLNKEDFVNKNPGWVEELNLMVKTMHMCEMEALGCLGWTYLVDVFLPLKLQEQDWI